MSLETIQVKFREYKSQSFTFLGKNGIKSTLGKRMPFLGYRKYCPEVLPIIESFSKHEFEVWTELTSYEHKKIQRHYTEAGSVFKLNDSAKTNDSVKKKIWKLLNKTSYLASYNNCLAHLSPDYNESIDIDKKYIYIFRNKKAQKATTFYREFKVKEKKYFQGEMNTNNITDSRGYKKDGENYIYLPKKEKNIEYEYLFILSKIKLSVKRIELLRKEIEQSKCYRAKKIQLFNDITEYNNVRNKSLSSFSEIAPEVKASLDTKYRAHKKKLNSKNIKDHLPFIPELSSTSYFHYTDIICNIPKTSKTSKTPKGSTHIIFLTDYFDLTNELKRKFDNQFFKYNRFMKEKDKKSGYSKSKLMVLNNHIAQIVKSKKKDSDDTIDFKDKLKSKLRVSKDGRYEYEKWREDYNSTLWNIKRSIEINGIYLSSAVDTNEFASLQYDYHYLKTKPNKSNKDEDIIDNMINNTGEIALSLMQSSAGLLCLEKLREIAVKNLKSLFDKKNTTININSIYTISKGPTDWISPIMTNISRKIVTGFSQTFTALAAGIPFDKGDPIIKIICHQKIILKNIKVKGSNKTAKKVKIAEDMANSFASKKAKLLNRNKIVTRTSDALEVELIETTIFSEKTNKNKFNKRGKALAYFCLGLELWNLYSAYAELGDDYSIFSAEFVNFSGAVFDTGASLLGICKELSGRTEMVLNIISSFFDYYVSCTNMFDSLNEADYDAAAFHGLSTLMTVGSIGSSIFIFHELAVGAALTLTTPAVLTAFIILVSCAILQGIFSFIADYLTDSDYEKWFNYCFWGKSYGKYSGAYSEKGINNERKGVRVPITTPWFSEVSPSKWNESPNGLKHQFRALYNIFYSPNIRLTYFADHTSIIIICISIIPVYICDNSVLKISASIRTGERGAVLLNLCKPDPLPLKYLLNAKQKKLLKGTNCDIDFEDTKNSQGKVINKTINKITVKWSNSKSVHRSVYIKELEKKVKDPKVKQYNLFLDVALELDMYGDGEAIVKTSKSLELKKGTVDDRAQKRT